ncbi:MAG: hypothetical protein RBT71_05460 [Flavobacteriales bacterium]|nr:hypothetical protein [Flavobacteriales bacterium]
MTAVYVGAGLLLLFTDALNDTVTRYRMAIGAILVAYGILRAVLYFTRRKPPSGTP